MMIRRIGGNQFAQMIRCAFARLQSQVDIVNSLNVFPVPDGDTGSNMLKTMQSGLTYVVQFEQQFEQQDNDKKQLSIGQVAEQFAKGLLFGARGNSGVILSQLFHGVAKALAEYDEADVAQFASALLRGVETAYEAVVSPVEGTILTVAKRAAHTGSDQASQTDDWTAWFESVSIAAAHALQETPELLPILKEAGVVDSGGQGLVFIYKGFVDALKNNGNLSDRPLSISDDALSVTFDQNDRKHAPQAHFAADDIVHFYDLEFFIRLHPEHGTDLDAKLEPMAERLTSRLSEIGDSVIVIPDGKSIKVHVHSNQPGKVLDIALEYGELIDIHIQNMREQFRTLQTAASPKTVKGSCFIAIASGEGIDALFQSLGSERTISGGDTMNTSAEEIIRACEETGAEHVFLLPNNSNILMAAEQAVKLSEQHIHVIPTRTIAQGLAAAVSFDANASVDENIANMLAAIENVKSGHVTFAVRDAHIDNFHLQENDYIGIQENKIVSASSDLFEACQQLLEKMIDEDDELLTVIVGKFADKRVTEQLETYLEQHYGSLEFEFHDGGQRLQFYIFSVE